MKITAQQLKDELQTQFIHGFNCKNEKLFLSEAMQSFDNHVTEVMEKYFEPVFTWVELPDIYDTSNAD